MFVSVTFVIKVCWFWQGHLFAFLSCWWRCHNLCFQILICGFELAVIWKYYRLHTIDCTNEIKMNSETPTWNEHKRGSHFCSVHCVWIDYLQHCSIPQADCSSRNDNLICWLCPVDRETASIALGNTFIWLGEGDRMWFSLVNRVTSYAQGNLEPIPWFQNKQFIYFNCVIWFSSSGGKCFSAAPKSSCSLTKYKKRKTMRMLRDLEDDLKSECYIMHA